MSKDFSERLRKCFGTNKDQTINAFIVMEKTPDGELEPFIYQDHPDSCDQYIIIKDEDGFKKFLYTLDDDEVGNFELKRCTIDIKL